jgi:beta-N-acetylhexosaminidase
VGFAALLQAVVALVAPTTGPPPSLPTLTPREKAALLVVSGLPAPRGVAGVLVQEWSRTEPRPRKTVVFTDQEGGSASTYDDLPPGRSARSFASVQEASAAGFDTGRALAHKGVWVDLAPVLDLAEGPLGSRHFARPAFGLAFWRGLTASGLTACVKHFPGLGAAPISTDASPHVRARLTQRQLAVFRRVVKAGARCVMVSHAFYGRFGLGKRASFNPAAYRLLRRLGYEWVAITDSVSVFGSREAVPSALKAVRAGADLVLFTDGRDAARAIRALVPWARHGLLDDHVRRVLRWRRSIGLGNP